MDNNQLGNNPQARLLNNLNVAMNNNGAGQLNPTIPNNNQVNPNTINNQNNVPLNVVPQNNNPVNMAFNNNQSLVNQQTGIIPNNMEGSNEPGNMPSNPFNNNSNIQTLVNQQTGIIPDTPVSDENRLQDLTNPFNTDEQDPRKLEMKDNNFNGDNLEHGFVDVLKEGGVNIDIPDNKYINNGNTFNETSINDLNVDGAYNKLPSIDYSNDPQVIANIKNMEKKNTIKISKELQTFFIIVVILFLFILVMPYIFDLVRDIKSR